MGGLAFGKREIMRERDRERDGGLRHTSNSVNLFFLFSLSLSLIALEQFCEMMTG